MDLFDVYPLYDLTPVSAQGCTITDEKGVEYLDLYGGHAVISVGHSHPHYVKRISDQLKAIGFYSNSVQNPMQAELAKKLGEISGYQDYNLFLCNSGAEANENALKLASFITGKKRVIAFEKSFHGRTSAAVAVTDNPKIVAPINDVHDRIILPLNDAEALRNALSTGEVAAVLIEGIQGIGGCRVPDPGFLQSASRMCKEMNVLFILDEIQSGYGRSGKFFAHQYAGIRPDVITVAKGMGNGFPMGGVLISPEYKPWHGMLGTTFGGNYLACAAGLAVLEIMEQEELVRNAETVGGYMFSELGTFSKIREVRGKGLMIGLEFDEPVVELRKKLLFEEKIFTGVTGTHVIRILPPLTLSQKEASRFLETFSRVLKNM
ncbi:MAG TPA: aminotransferase class III-fold pyridoxal phosphate-dependent enzyme [Prolixibacteraceae bacterium]|nr:aminotransferase class III-fold pyridoxal phosphate-dependent enzyme [Prolixibacteraceae bacterium]